MAWADGAPQDVAADVSYMALFTVLLPLIRLLFNKLIAAPLGRRLVLPSKKKSDDPPSAADLLKLEKFKESLFKGVFYTFTTTLAFLSCYKSEYLYETRKVWVACTRIPCEALVVPGTRWLYIIEFAYYIQAVPCVFFWDAWRKDSWGLVAHHIATAGLIGYSYHVNFTKAGLLIMMLHDVNDIFLEFAKLGRYINVDALATGSFIVFALSWFVTRLYYFPFHVMKATLVYCKDVARENNITVEPHYTILNAMLIFLLILHIYWSWLILKIVHRTLLGSQLDDVREDDD